MMVKDDSGVDDNPGEATVLTWSDERGTTRQMHFTLEVRGGGTAPTQLVGSVNGSGFRPLTPGLGFSGGLGLCVSAAAGPVDILWDKLSVTRLDP